MHKRSVTKGPYSLFHFHLRLVRKRNSRLIRLDTRVRVLDQQETAPGCSLRFGSVFHPQRYPVAAAGELIRMDHRAVQFAVEGLHVLDEQLLPVLTSQKQLPADEMPALFQFIHHADAIARPT